VASARASDRSRLAPLGPPPWRWPIWTTTPWTLPANLAVSVNGTLTTAIWAGASRTMARRWSAAKLPAPDRGGRRWWRACKPAGAAPGTPADRRTAARRPHLFAIRCWIAAARGDRGGLLHHRKRARLVHTPRATAWMKFHNTGRKYNLPVALPGGCRRHPHCEAAVRRLNVLKDRQRRDHRRTRRRPAPAQAKRATPTATPTTGAPRTTIFRAHRAVVCLGGEGFAPRRWPRSPRVGVAADQRAQPDRGVGARIGALVHLPAKRTWGVRSPCSITVTTGRCCSMPPP